MRRGVEVITVITALFFAGSDQMSCNAGIKHGNGQLLWCDLNGSGRSNNIPFPTSFQNSITVCFYSLLPLTRCTHAPVLLCHVFYWAQCAACAYRRTRQSPRQQHGQGGKGTDICSLSFGHSLSLLSYSTSKLTLLHSNAAPVPPPNWAWSIGYSTCKTL